MGRRLRSETMNPEVSGIYHCYNQFAQQAFLAGVDPVTGRDYSCRRLWLQRELAGLAGEFAIDVLLYALMANHYHLLLRNRPDLVAEWDDFEVLMRWERIVNRVWRPDDSGQIPPLDWTPNWNQVDRVLEDEAHLKTLRLRLSDPSWLIRLWCQSFSRYANKQTGHRGACFQGRFDSVPLVDEAAVLACAMYIDLNPIRAGAASTPEQAEFSSARDRILGRALRSHRATASGLMLPEADRLPVELAYAETDDPDHWLAPLAHTTGAKLAAILKAWFPEADTIEWSSFETDAEVVTSLQEFLEQSRAPQTNGEASESEASHRSFSPAPPAPATPFVVQAAALAPMENVDSISGTAETNWASSARALDNRHAATALESATPAQAAATAAVEIGLSLDVDSTVRSESASASAWFNWPECVTASPSSAENPSVVASPRVDNPVTTENAPNSHPSERGPCHLASDLPPLVSLTASTDPWATRALEWAAASFEFRRERFCHGSRATAQDLDARGQAPKLEKLLCSHAICNGEIPRRFTFCTALVEPGRRRSLAVFPLERPVFWVARLKSRDDDVAESDHVGGKSPLALNPIARHLARLYGGRPHRSKSSNDWEANGASRRAPHVSLADDPRRGGDARIQCANWAVVIASPRERHSRPIPAKHRDRWKKFLTARARPRPRAARDGLLDMTIDEYLEALDWAGRQLRRGKFGAIPRAAPPILERLARLTDVPTPPGPDGILAPVSEATIPVSPAAMEGISVEAGAPSQGAPSPVAPTGPEEWPADAPAALRTSGIRASALEELLTSFSAMFRTVAGNASSVERFLATRGRRPGKAVANSAAAFD